MKYYYATCARVPGKKAHCSQIAQMCRAFVETGLDLELLHPARSAHGDYKNATIEGWYGFDREIPSRALSCIDYVGRIPDAVPHFVTSIAYRTMVATFNRSLVKFLKGRPEEFVIYSRDPRVMQRVKETFPETPAYLELHMLRDRPVSKWENGMFQSMDGIVVVTNRMKEMLRARGVPEDRVLVEPNGVDQKVFPGTDSKTGGRERLGLDPGRKYITFVGNFRALNVDRGLGTIVQGMSGVIDRFPEATFLFVGGPMQFAQPYMEKLNELGIDEANYRFVDRQPYNEIRFWLAASDILVHPVPDHPIYTNITSPLKIFEYMTAGRPIVASDLPSIREILTHDKTALLAPPGDTTGFADALLRILSNAELADKLAENAVSEVAERSWEARAERISRWMRSKHRRG